MTDWQAQHGQGDAALAAVQERIDAGGSGRAGMMAIKATVLGWMGRKDEAIATIDQAVAAKPGDPSLLNDRCWLKGQLDLQLDTALKDCTKSIELSDDPAPALDSRALVYYRLNRPDDALADLASALESSPNEAGSLFLEGVIHGHAKNGSGGDDLTAAQIIEPGIAEEYGRFGVKP